MDEDAVQVSGPGSEKRTRFLGLVGVFRASRLLWLSSSGCCTTFVLIGSMRPELIRLLRRTARGRSSGIWCSSCSTVFCAIVGRLLGIGLGDVVTMKEDAEEMREQQLIRINSRT